MLLPLTLILAFATSSIALAESAMHPIATFRAVRHVAMYYSLDLAEHNAHSPAMAAVLSANDAMMRECYTSRLARAPQLRGRLVFQVHLSRADGGIASVKQIDGGTLSDTSLARCLAKRLVAMPFAPPEDMVGTLTYDFDASATFTDVAGVAPAVAAFTE